MSDPAPRREFTARYLVESFEPIEKGADVIAGEQSCGTFLALPGETAALVDTLCAADIDVIKDRELMGDPPHAPLEARMKVVMALVNRHADRMDRKIMVAFNISDDADAMRRHHDLVLARGRDLRHGERQLDGPAAITALRRHSVLPIHGHRNDFGMMNRSPALGSTDLFFLAGGGIIGHPSGPTAGVRSLAEAWQAAVEGVDIHRYAASRPALREALAAFGAGREN